MATQIKKILVVCIGNSDRSPVMAAVLGLFLKNAGHEVETSSAGIEAKEGCAAEFGVQAAKRLGLDISSHRKTHTDKLNLADYDLIVCMDDRIAGVIVERGGDIGKVYNAGVSNPWPVKFAEQYDTTMRQILTASYDIVSRYFSTN